VGWFVVRDDRAQLLREVVQASAESPDVLPRRSVRRQMGAKLGAFEAFEL
jgi:hypothetical protein